MTRKTRLLIIIFQHELVGENLTPNEEDKDRFDPTIHPISAILFELYYIYVYVSKKKQIKIYTKYV